MKISLVSVLSVLGCVATAARNPYLMRPGRLIPPMEESDMSALAVAAEPVNTTGSAYFDQPLDHQNPSKGTFKQRYWWNSEYYAGPGSPIVMFTPGEIAAAGYGAYLTNATIIGLYAQEIKGAVIMVEHRYWGDSSPYDDLNAETLQYLTLDQAIHDFTNFARTANLPFDPSGSSKADKAPWVISGGSYSGSLAAWIESTAPGTFWAYHASSAPVEAIKDYWQYFVPIQQGMPKNCSADVSRVIDYMDKVFTGKNETAKILLKEEFGLGALEHYDDVMAMLEWGPWQWQSNSFYTGYSAFYKFCDRIENVAAGAATTPDENGVGLPKALKGYAAWMKEDQIPGYCQTFGYTDELETECMDTYNPSNKIFTDHSVGNSIDLQWQWMLCNEPFGWWQNGGPKNKPSIVSRLIKSPYWTRQCDLFFPTTNGFTYGMALSPDNNEHKVNKHTKGWRLTDTKRLIWTNGEFDPWRTASMSSEFRPGGPFQGTVDQPLNIIPHGIHCSDLRLKNGLVNEGVQNVIDIQVKQIVQWVSEYPKKS